MIMDILLPIVIEISKRIENLIKLIKYVKGILESASNKHITIKRKTVPLYQQQAICV